VNGVLLAAAVAGDASAATFLECRDTWLDVADLGGMLRKAKEPNLPSLLLGDDYFLSGV
jgi:hypothetical protein